MTPLTLTPILAAPNFEVYKLVLIALFMLAAPLFKKISEAREQAERTKNPRPPGPRPPAVPPRRENEVRGAEAVWNANPAEATPSTRRDNPFRNEIEQFLEEVGKRRPAAGGPQRSVNERGTTSAAPSMPRPIPLQPPSQRAPTPIQRTTVSPVRVKPEPPKAPPLAAPQTPPLRPGAEIAQRKAPVSDDLGAQVRAHLNQYLESSRLSQRARAELGSAVERAVREHLGATATVGLLSQDESRAAMTGASIVSLLHNPSGVRTAILLNEILERPRCLRPKT